MGTLSICSLFAGFYVFFFAVIVVGEATFHYLVAASRFVTCMALADLIFIEVF